MHSLEYSTFPSLIFVRRYTEHPFCRAVAGCRQGKSCHQPLSEREGKAGSSTQGSRVALPGASELSLQVFRPAKTLPIFTDSHEGTYMYFFFPPHLFYITARCCSTCCQGQHNIFLDALSVRAVQDLFSRACVIVMTPREGHHP